MSRYIRDVLIHTHTHTQTPSWLEEMIQYTSWRELFYQLAEQYPDCIMLKFTLKLISDAGFQGEITSASTAIHQPDAFSSLIRSVLIKMASSKPADMQRCMRELTNLIIHNQQTYLYSQVVLHALDSTVSLRNLQLWIREELQKDAQERNYNVTNMSLYFRGVGSHEKLFEALAAMLSRNALNPADMSILYKHYADEGSSPPVHYIHIPQLLGKAGLTAHNTVYSLNVSRRSIALPKAWVNIIIM